mgnify:CR=1 FL=1
MANEQTGDIFPAPFLLVVHIPRLRLAYPKAGLVERNSRGAAAGPAHQLEHPGSNVLQELLEAGQRQAALQKLRHHLEPQLHNLFFDFFSFKKRKKKKRKTKEKKRKRKKKGKKKGKKKKGKRIGWGEGGKNGHRHDTLLYFECKQSVRSDANGMSMALSSSFSRSNWQ